METQLGTFKDISLANNTEYYKHVFKKTEKILGAVFYTFRSNYTIDHNDVLIKQIEEQSQKVTRVLFDSLRAKETDTEFHSREMAFTLIELETTLRFAYYGKLLSGELLTVFMQEIDTVQRTLRTLTNHDTSNPFSTAAHTLEGTVSAREAKERRVAERKPGVSLGISRTSRIVAILKDKGSASIKDITEMITDVSEKTIQRELNVLIKDNVIRREGERRWSKYIPL